MLGDGATRWALSALFAATGAWYLAAAVRARPGRGAGRRDLVSAGLHAAMSAAMLGVLWPWGAAIPPIAQVTAFTAGTAWFAGHALFGAGQGGAGHGRQYLDWYRSAMTAAMVWMPVVMPVLPMSPAVAGTVATGTAVAGGGMTGMPGMAGLGDRGGAGAAPPEPPVAWAAGASVAVAVALLAVAACYLVAALRPVVTPGQRVRAAGLLHDGAGILMAAGMAAVLLEMT